MYIDAAERIQNYGYLFYTGPRDLGRLVPPYNATANTDDNSQ